ncbi:hypothetical protein N7468_004132 [Penicillium chermesinum]|uniref:Autophagy-related protein 11 n=1 Tax=Penicillium chermesinum TaxID=63820 RepID=A0A9W9TSW8_9EURO|nr:uncharacterized protein N7468_004132 [Penicillium chermesinum]KAJ5239513.1 hypothetical protein N7468_004132 [Penicillium chermesinum]
MSLHIYIAHSGEHLLADPVSFASPEALKSWILRNTAIPAQRQILMTARGKNVKIQTLATENEIFVYDRQFVLEPGEIELPELPIPQPFKPTDPPASLTDQNDLQAWRNLFMARRSWALEISSQCSGAGKALQEHNERSDVINRAVGVALENLKSHVGNLEHRFQEAQTWANNLLEEQQAAIDGWQQALTKLEDVPARKDFPLLGRPSTPKLDTNRPTGTLSDFIDRNEVQQAGTDAAAAFPRFAGQIQSLEKTVGDIASSTQSLLEEVETAGGAEGDDGLLEEVETIAKKIGSDYEHVLGLPNNQKMLANVSRLALNHTQNLLPSLLAASGDLHQALRYAVQRRAAAEKSALQHMRTISMIESRLADAHAQIGSLDVDSHSFDVIYSVFQMPLIYGSILIEAVRRREWSEKIKTDSMNLAEEMAILRDEEQRRRKKWLKSMGDYIPSTETTTPGLRVDRKEIELYIEELRSTHSLTNFADDLSQQLKDLDSPTRQQRRRTKAFKNGSIFDNSRSSMLLRGDDMVRTLQEEKTKLEERLKGSDSRIRKLEDLLHRQSHLSRPSSGNFGVDFPSSPASPHPDALSRRSSVSSRRVSMNQSPEDRALVQRIVTLEAELSAEKETVQRLHKEAHAERQSNSDKYQEAQSTKKDLIGNLEARQREFEEERRFLETESKKLRLRNEEIEEELDRLMDTLQHEKQDHDERIHQLETDLATAHTATTEEMRKTEDLQSRIQSQEEKEHALQTKLDDLERDRVEQGRRDTETHNALQAALMSLSPGGSVPNDLPGLIKAVEVLSEGLSIHAKNADDNASKLVTENKILEEKIEKLEAEAVESNRKLHDQSSDLAALKEEASQLQVQLDTAKAELEQERSKLKSLQTEITAGESGSAALRQQLAEEERRNADLTRRLAEADSRASRSRAELDERTDTTAATGEHAVSRDKDHEARCFETSQQLYSQIEKLERMLEQLGFAIIQQDGRLVIQRASRLSTSTSGLGESLAQSAIVSAKPDSSLLGWMHAESPEEEEAKFSAFMESLKRFDVGAFGDVVVKRLKDIETLARKWQKEARGYRDKYHRVQSEAHDKIAYRSFKEGDLALFLPTRNQAIRSWAAFNVGAPHYFLREQDSHKLQSRDWLLARISKIEERVVDLSKSMNSVAPERNSQGETSDGASFEDENPFELSDGLRWYLLDANEEKPGAPATPGIAKSTVASARVDAKGSIRLKRPTEESTVAQTLSRSLESRRNSSNSKRGTPAPSQRANDSGSDLVRPAEADAGPQPREADPIFDEVRRDLLLGP